MALENVLVKAARKSWRFNSQKGLITFEDLWKLPLNQLDDIAVHLDQEIKNIEGNGTRISFLSDRSVETQRTLEVYKDKFEIVKFVLDTKVLEEKAAKETAADNARLQELYATLEAAVNRENSTKSPAEVQKMIDEFKAKRLIPATK